MSGANGPSGRERRTGSLYRDRAVVVRTHKLGEADRIVVLLTAEHGKVRAVAKGVRKTKSRFGGRLEPLTHVNLLLYRGRELDIVNQAETVDPTRPLMDDLDRLTQGLALLEVVDRLTPDREPVPDLYRMLVGALRTLGSQPSLPSSGLVVPAFFWKVLAAEGVRPELDRCVRCGQDEPLVAFDLDEGGALCRSCRQGVALSPGALALLRQILGGELNAALASDPGPASHEVSVLATRAMEHHLERGLRAVALLERH
ncbi:MAG TPA: DNA repair protein RecO [Acidimicrobiales bacterium]